MLGRFSRNAPVDILHEVDSSNQFSVMTRNIGYQPIIIEGDS